MGLVLNSVVLLLNFRNYSYFDAHEHGARRIAKVAREMGVQRLIHMSALNASENPVPALGGLFQIVTRPYSISS